MFLIFEGIVYTMVLNLYNPFIQMFAKRMGAQDIHIALLNSIPPLVAIFILIPLGIVIERINRKKKTVLVLLGISSFFYGAIALVPVIPHEAKVVLYVIFIGLLNFPNSLYLATWQSFFADNFTGTYAKRVYSVRSKFGQFAGLFTVLISGIMLTSIPKNDQERLFLYQIFYVTCFVLTLLEIYLFSKVDEKRAQQAESNLMPVRRQAQGNSGEVSESSLAGNKSKISFKINKSDFAGIIKNKEFIIFCACGVAFHFSWQMGWPLYFIYNVDYAHLNEFQLSLISLVAGLAQFVSFSRWTRLAEKRGSNLALFLGAAGVAINPLFYGTQLSFPVLLLMNALSGAFLAGFNLSLFYSLLETLPNENKTVYISVFNTLTNTTGFVAPLVGVWVYGKTGIFAAMVIVGALRVAASLSYLARWRRGAGKAASES